MSDQGASCIFTTKGFKSKGFKSMLVAEVIPNHQSVFLLLFIDCPFSSMVFDFTKSVSYLCDGSWRLNAGVPATCTAPLSLSVKVIVSSEREQFHCDMKAIITIS